MEIGVLDFDKLKCREHPLELISNYCLSGTFTYKYRTMYGWALCSVHLLTHLDAHSRRKCPYLQGNQRHTYVNL